MHTMSTTQRTLLRRSKVGRLKTTKSYDPLMWPPCLQVYQLMRRWCHSRQIEHWHHLIWQNVIDNGWYHHASETVSKMHLLCIQRRRLLSANPLSGDGVPCVSYFCNLYMEDYEERALATAPNPPRIWKRYADDTFTVNKREYSQEFCDHLN